MKLLPNKIVQRLGDYSLRKGGKEYIFTCPWCRKKKLEVNFDKNRFNCFRCKEGGTVPWLAKRLKIEGAHPYVLGEMLKFKNGSEFKLGEPIKIPGYEEVTFYSRDMAQFIKSRGVDIARAVKQGWGPTSDMKLFGRMIIPIRENGMNVCWVARSINGLLPKELCPSSSVANRSHFLYNIDEVREGDRVVLVEGIFGCEAILKRGLVSVASMGSNLSDTQVGKLIAKRPYSINIMYDGDEAGRKGAAAAFDKIFRRFHRGVYIVHLPEGKQPDTLTDEDWLNIRLI